MVNSNADASLRSLTPSTKLLAVDVLRGLAALGVTWFHSRVDLWVGFRAIHASPHSYSLFDRILSFFSLPVSLFGGFVMLFFVLSGFCIHLPNVEIEAVTPFRPLIYGVRRFFRIVPAYLVVLIFCLLASVLLWITRSAAMPNWRVYGFSALMLQNWLLGGTQVDINPSLWSIPVEVEFYIFYPLLLFLWRRHGFVALVVLTLSCTAIGLYFFASGSPWAGTTFFAYSLIWNSGAWLAEAFSRGRLPNWNRYCTIVFFMVLVLTVVGSLRGINDFWLHFGWGVLSFLLLLWTLGVGRSIFWEDRKWLKPWLFVGTVSYSLYLLHFPIFRLAGTAWVAVYGSKPDSFLVPTFSTLLVIPFAWIFYRLIELPTHHFARDLAHSIKYPEPKPRSATQ